MGGVWYRRTIRPSEGPTTLVGFAGDTLLGYPDGREVRIDPAVMDALAECDHLVINQEGPLTSAPSVKAVGVSLGAPADCVRQIVALRATVANLANNHIMDHGPEGLSETLAVLRRQGITPMGAGMDSRQAREPLRLDLPGGGKLALLAFCHNEGSLAGTSNPGPMPLDLPKVQSSIARLRADGYVVCVSYHGGQEYFRIPHPRRRGLLKALASAGANVVISHHAHVMQGLEVAGEQVIAYGLGNFHFNIPFQYQSYGISVGLVIGVEMDRRGPCALRHMFVFIDRPQSALLAMSGPASQAAERLLRTISAPLADEADHRRAWRLACLLRITGGDTVPRSAGGRNPARAVVACRITLSIIRRCLWSREYREILSAAILGLLQWPISRRSRELSYLAHERSCQENLP